VIRILSAKYVDVRSVGVPLTRPATSFVFAGKGDSSVPRVSSNPFKSFDTVDTSGTGMM
jgi:hypothetical protein